MSAVRFVVPANWSNLTEQNLSELRCTADTLGEALRWLAGQYPAVANRILTPEGQIPRYATVALDGERVSDVYGLDWPLSGADHEVCVLSAFMGG
ncbi:hypothetical protein [Nocardia sp. R6R-6]|uniref:hypothetical protein n=1 Tax=Nocardia sp. R6R-6 TaxID=3459303 RepID=UPI00403DE7B0